MKIKTLDDIWQEYIDKNQLSNHSIQDLAYHIEYDPSPLNAMSVAADCNLKQLAEVIAKQLDNEDGMVREWSVGCLLGRLQAYQYAAEGLKMAQEDPVDTVRAAAINYLGCVIAYIPDQSLKNEIAKFLLRILSKASPDSMNRDSAYDSILYAMNIPFNERPDFSKELDFENDIDVKIIKQFKKNYLREF